MFNPYVDVALAGVIWGSAGVFIKILKLSSTTVTFLRLLVPTLILLVYFSLKKQNLLKGINKQIAFASSVNGLRMYLYFLAYSLTSIGNAVIMLYTWPLFVTIYSVFLLKEKISQKKLILIIVAFIGILLMFSNKSFSFKNNDFIGMMAMLVSSAMYALTIPLFKKQLEKFTKIQTIFYQNVVGAIIFIPFLFINKPYPTISQLVTVSLYAILIGLIGFFLFFSALKKLKASTTSIMSYIEVLSAMIFGYIFFKEVPTLPMIIGGSIILLSSFLVRYTD